MFRFIPKNWSELISVTSSLYLLQYPITLSIKFKKNYILFQEVTMKIYSYKNLIFLFIFIILLASTHSFAQQKIYFIESRRGNIQRANTDGSQLENVVVSRLDGPLHLTIDTVNDKVYWTETGRIMRMDMNGDNVEMLIDLRGVVFSPYLAGIVLDVNQSKMYWINKADDKIQRANLDGSDIEDLVTNLVDPLDLALDLSNQKMYWTGSGFSSGIIQRANIDGTNVEDLLETGFSPEGISLDVANSKMYWVDKISNNLQQANLDGSNVTEIVSDIENPVDVVINSNTMALYWLDVGRSGASGKIQRANIDGSNIQELATELDNPVGLALNPEDGSLLWTDDQYAAPAYIGRVNDDGSDEQVILTEIAGFRNLKIEQNQGKLYWMDFGSGSIMRSELDGTEITPLIETIGGTEFVFDSQNQKIYWAESNSIHRANYDGTNVEDLITSDVDDPKNLVLDIAGSKMYWLDGGYYSDKIRRANPDGTDIVDFITDVDEPTELRFNSVDQKIYWLESGTFPTSIRRVGIDGSGIEDVVTGESGINSFLIDHNSGILFWSYRDIKSFDLNGGSPETAIDVTNQNISEITIDNDMSKIYWNDDDNDGNAIWSANYDGSDPQMLISGLPVFNERPIVISGSATIDVEKDPEIKIAENFKLNNAYPNPFNPTTIISYQIGEPASVQLRVYNLNGQLIETLVDGHQESGAHRVQWNAEDVSSGVYLFRLTAGNYSQTMKGTLLR
ncbi:DUF5050 domain-containing protein [candidate division KSB1 bacterium]|nr:DUF5050 domain-containing protein [candidate division KSB1 bacterium]